MRYEFYTPEEIELMKKALQCIEAVAELECSGPNNHSTACKFCEIYTLAHAGRSPSCGHPDWKEKIEKLHKAFAGEGLA